MKTPKFLFPLIFTLLVLGVFLGLTEMILRISGYGIDTKPFQLVGQNNTLWVDNLNFHKKYYSDWVSAPDEGNRVNLFQAKKTEGVIRGFVIGESTPQGFPFHPRQSFSSMAEQAINLYGKKGTVEIINVSKTAMTSYFVRDLAPKLLEYEPDFLVVYVGHNEYYGNVSQSTGFAHWQRLLFLFLREFRIFQLVDDVFSAPPTNSHSTVMASRFGQKEYPIDQKRDNELESNYIENLRVALTPWQDRGLPVFVITPVSNLVALPPFRGGSLETIQDRIREFSLRLAENKIVDEEHEWLKRELAEHPLQPHLRWLSAITSSSSESSIADFVRAKDADTVPFRARSGLIEKLRGFISSQKGIHLIDLQNDLELELGLIGFGHLFFIDHVHFNSLGQVYVARKLAGQLIKHLPLDVNRPQLAAAFENAELIQNSVFTTDLSQYFALMRVSQILSDEPFKSQLIPYRSSVSRFLETNSLVSDPRMSRVWTQDSESEVLAEVLRVWNEDSDSEKILNEFASLQFQNPADPTNYVNMALVLIQMNVSDKEIMSYLALPLKLNNKKQTFQSLLQLAKSNDRMELFDLLMSRLTD